MISGIQPGTEKRVSFSRACSELGVPLSVMCELIKEMRGKTDEEKEQIAERLEKQLRGGVKRGGFNRR